MKNQIGVFLLFLWVSCASASATLKDRWGINSSGGITWQVDERIPHADHIEMSGLRVSVVLRYGVDANRAFSLNRSLIWPMLRTIPNNTHASLKSQFTWSVTDMIRTDGRSLPSEKVKDITLDGTMVVRSEFLLQGNGKLELTRVLFPSVSQPALCEKYKLRNIGEITVPVEISSFRTESLTDPAKGMDGSYKLVSAMKERLAQQLKPGEEVTFGAFFAGYREGENEIALDIDRELRARQEQITGFWDKLILETPDPVINRMFAFAKIRAAESIYETKGGLMHGPGGEAYYAAIWANDQAEYMNPFFPYMGYEVGNRSALCSFEHFARFMNPYYKPIPSSIIAEGTDVWAGAGDRGDAAMIAYGAARYSLSRGDKKEAEKLWPLIEWCLEYCKRKLNAEGVVVSDADELEGRFPAGEANLCTSCLYYDALCSASFLGKDLAKPASLLSEYSKQAETLRKNIDSYFGGTIEGFDAYRYYKGNDVLRSWICMPLTVGIYDRKDATLRALFSPRLWTDNGLLTQAGSETFWDRSTLYALRGVFAAGETEKGLDFLRFYSSRRLLGEHVPYAIEAWPEGSQRHLSAESGLFCRIITEGMFGIRPTGLQSFQFTPRLPKDWDKMSLRKIGAFGRLFDMEVFRLGNNRLEVSVKTDGKTLIKRKIKEGDRINIKF